MGGNGPGERHGGDKHADPGDDAREAAAAERVGTAAAELYGADLETFTDCRKALAAAAKTAGDTDAAAAIAALRKPTRAAWLVNRLARAEPDAPARLAALAAALRAAQQDKDGPALRELSAARGALIDALTAQALAAASVTAPPTSLRDEVAATLTAALADPTTAAGFAAGTLTKAAHWSGFGAADFAPSGGASVDGAVPAPDRSGAEPTRRARPARPAQGVPALPRLPGPSLEQQQRAAQRRDDQQEQRAHEREQRDKERGQQLAREAAERAAQQREQYQDVERKVVSAASATAEAGAAEDRLESQVRDLEERLTKAREDLAAARRRARHAETAERRARQVLDRLPVPEPGSVQAEIE